MIETLPSSAGGMGSIPSQGAKHPLALWSKTKHKTEQYCNNFNKDF